MNANIIRAKVVIGDNNAQSGERLASELTGSKFVQCDATVWEDQARLFREAAQLSSSGKIHYVICNAGMTKEDQTFTFDGKSYVSTVPHAFLLHPLRRQRPGTEEARLASNRSESQGSALYIKASHALFRVPEWYRSQSGPRRYVLDPYQLRRRLSRRSQISGVQQHEVGGPRNDACFAKDGFLPWEPGECYCAVVNNSSFWGT
jgi:hypothetical protein